MAHRRQCRCKFVHALGHPDQGPHGVAQRGRLDQALEFGDEPWIVLGNRLAPTTGAANLPLCQRRRVEIVLAAIDRRTGEPGDPRDDREPAPSSGAHLASRKQPPAALIERRANRFPAIANGVLVDHATDLRLFAQIGNPRSLSHTDARPRSAIPLLSGTS